MNRIPRRRAVWLVAILVSLAPGLVANAQGTSANPDASVPSPDALVIPDLKPDIGPGAKSDGLAPVIRLGVSQSRVEIGREFLLRLRIEHRRQVQVELSARVDYRGVFEERRRASPRVETVGTHKVTTYELVLVGWQPGEHRIPPLSVTYKAEGVSKTVASDPIRVEVLSMITSDDAEMRGDHPPAEVRVTDWKKLWIVGSVVVGVLGLIVVAVVVRFLRRRRAGASGRGHGRAKRGRTKRLPPAAEALIALDDIESSGLLAGTDFKPVYTECSRIIRVYVGRRLSFPATDLTTAETRQRLAVHSDEAPSVREIGRWLELGDLVKFASAEPTLDEARGALRDMRGLIETIEGELARRQIAVSDDHREPSG